MGLEITLPTQILPTVQSVDSLLRTIAQVLLTDIRERIHEQGLNAKGSKIGIYSSSYLKYRMEKGRGSGSSVILSFTRQMQNDWKIIPVKGGYGLGFSNNINAIKAEALQYGQGTVSVKGHTVRAHTRKGPSGKKYKVESYQVGPHSRQGLKGYGPIYQLTPNEINTMQLIIDDWLKG
jgi:hypothetical protein